MESLVGKSLVKQTEAHGEPRFAMLETIREYAGERLIAAGEKERLRERHRDYFLALAEEAEPKLKVRSKPSGCSVWTRSMRTCGRVWTGASQSGSGRRSSVVRGAATVLV